MQNLKVPQEPISRQTASPEGNHLQASNWSWAKLLPTSGGDGAERRHTGCEALSLCTQDLATYTWVLKSWVGSVGAFWKIFSSLSTYLKAKSRRVGGALAWAQRKREGSNYLPAQLTGSLSGELRG